LTSGQFPFTEREFRNFAGRKLMLGHRQMTMEDYMGILRRHAWLLIVPPIVLCVAAYVVSLEIPNRYTSQTQVLVQAPRVPTEIVQPVITEALNDRLAFMKEQILSRSRLLPIIERFNLFSDSNLPEEAKVLKLHDAILVEPIHAMEETRASQLPGFRISVTLGEAHMAQQVCAEITNLFLEENSQSREAQAMGTTAFLDKHLEAARAKMNEQDGKLAAFKRSYLGSLPDEVTQTLGMLNGLTAQMDAVTQGLDRDQQTKIFTQAMLDQQLSAWKASQNPITGGASPDTLQSQLKKAQDDLVELQGKYTDEWPAVRQKKGEIEQLKQKIAAAQANKPPEDPKDRTSDAASNNLGPEPAAIQQLRAQISSIDVSIRGKTREQQDLRNKIHASEARLQLSPAVEQQYKELTRDFQTAQEEYSTLLKQRDAAVRGADLEVRQQGEQFKILDTASLPGKPNFPPRLAIAGGGFAGGLAVGLGLILLMEMKDKSIRTEGDIELFLKIPTLALIPVVDTRSTSKKRFVFQNKNEASLEAGT
jgi:polysaccharide chain length determinant protein (PEP-CTERM system associated)